MHIQTFYTSTGTQEPLITAETFGILHHQIKILTTHSRVLHMLTLPLFIPSSLSISYDRFFLSYITWPDTEIRSCIINTTPALLTAVTLHKKKLLIFYHIHKLKQSRKYMNLTADMLNPRVLH
jgi:hypothetical protein